MKKFLVLILVMFFISGCYTLIKKDKAIKMINDLEKTQKVSEKIINEIDQLFIEYDETKNSIINIKQSIYDDTNVWRGLDEKTKESLIKLWTIAVRVDTKIEELKTKYPILKEKAKQGYDVLEETQVFLEEFTKQKVDYNQVSIAVAKILLKLATKK